MRAPRHRNRTVPAAATLAAVLVGCSHVTQRPELRTLAEAPAPGPDTTLLKAHMRSGDVYLITSWQVVDSGASLDGTGVRYDALRVRRDSGRFTLSADSIALLETNVAESHYPFGLQALGFLTVVYGAVSAACLADPKSCFGSCPTFYVEDGTREVLQAEGFSASVARVLEASDIDPLYAARPSGRRFAVVMRNEAQETHVVRSVRLRVVPRPADGRVFATADGRYYAVPRVAAPAACTAPEGDCLAAVRALDTLERRSLTDSSDLAARETVELDFPAVPGPAGVVLGARHTFVSTYLFYQTLAYMGRSAGEWLAQLERMGPDRMPQALGLMKALGGIEIAVLDPDGSWRRIGTYDEAGPIATDVQIFPLGDVPRAERVHVRLRMARGSWRIGYVALAGGTVPATARTLDPVAVERGGVADHTALEALTDTARYLTAFPGDAYRIVFRLPADYGTYELFLESRGYYYEWIRNEWLAEENPLMVALVLADPGEALRRLAGPFKQVEPRMETLFWQSRFGR